MATKNIPDDFYKVADDFLRDLIGTFPELKDNMNEDLLAISSRTAETVKEDIEPHYVRVFEHIMLILPVRFFDILYENSDMYEESESNCEFLPGIDFKVLWQANITDKTKTVIWKYLQLLLIMVVGHVDTGESFGDTAKLFEAIDDDALKEKLTEALGGISSLFDTAGDEEDTEGAADSEGGAAAGPDVPGFSDTLPNADELHEHLNGLLGGKLGALAKEIADETAADLEVDLADVKSTSDVFQKLLKDPKKLFGLVHSVGSKIDKKIKAGDIKESELIEEATEMLKKMKEMPGMSGMDQMFKNMAGGGGKMDFKAMQNQLSGNLRNAKQKERMLAKLKERQAAAELAAKMMADGAAAAAADGAAGTGEGSNAASTFSSGETVDKTPRKKKKKPTNKKKKKGKPKK